MGGVVDFIIAKVVKYLDLKKLWVVNLLDAYTYFIYAYGEQIYPCL